MKRKTYNIHINPFHNNRANYIQPVLFWSDGAVVDGTFAEAIQLVQTTIYWHVANEMVRFVILK